MRETVIDSYERVWWINSKLQQESFLLALACTGRDEPVDLSTILQFLPPNYASLCLKTLRGDADPNCSLKFFDFEEKGYALVQHDPLDGNQYHLTSEGRQYCGALLAKYQIDPERSSHIGDILDFNFPEPN